MRPWAYPIELRERAVAAYERGNVSEAEIAALFGIGEASLRRWRQRKRDKGSVAAGARASGPELRVGPKHESIVRKLVAEYPDAFVEDLAIRFVEETQRPCSRSAMGRALDRLGLTRKKRR